MRTPRLKPWPRRRPPIQSAAGSADTPRGVHTQPPPLAVSSLTAPADAAWEAIVEQLLGTPSRHEAYEAQPDTEYAWAQRLGMHINRAPRRPLT